MASVRIGVIGDRNQANPTHVFTDASLQHAATALDVTIETVWLATDRPADYERVHGLIGSPGSPYRSFAGALAGIRHAREHDVPFIGTCGGSQHMMIEYARNVMGIEDAAHAETDPYASRLFITPLSCSLVGQTMAVAIKPGSKAAAAIGALRSMEAYYCNFGLNPAYRQVMEDSGLAVTGTDDQGEARIVELASHPFFLGTLFVPQARSRPGQPHPLIMAFCQAAMARANRPQDVRVVV